jgi:hypothetical protein
LEKSTKTCEVMILGILGQSVVSIVVHNTIRWETFRRVSRGNQDYLGPDEEINDFETAWRFLSNIVVEPGIQVNLPEPRRIYSPSHSTFVSSNP